MQEQSEDTGAQITETPKAHTTSNGQFRVYPLSFEDALKGIVAPEPLDTSEANLDPRRHEPRRDRRLRQITTNED